MRFWFDFAAPKHLGAATFYVATLADATGQPLEGDRTYRLRIPADVPVKQYWAVTAYDLESAAFIKNAPVLGIDSYGEAVQKNADGSVDVWFGPKAPAGNEANWIATAPGKRWFSFFRFYGPEKSLFEKTWKLNDIEPVS